MTDQPIGAFSARPTKAEAQLMRDEADRRYRNLPHADPRVGRAKYRAAIDAINALCGERADV